MAGHGGGWRWHACWSVNKGASNGLLRKTGTRDGRGLKRKESHRLKQMEVFWSLRGLLRKMNINGGGFSMVEAITDGARRVSWVRKRGLVREKLGRTSSAFTSILIFNHTCCYYEYHSHVFVDLLDIFPLMLLVSSPLHQFGLNNGWGSLSYSLWGI